MVPLRLSWPSPACSLSCVLQSVFYVFGASGFVWNVLWVLLVGGATPEKDYHVALTSPQKQHEAEGQAEEEEASKDMEEYGSRSKHHSVPAGAVGSGVTARVAKQLLSCPPVWAIVAAHVSYNWGHYLVLSWLPTWLNEHHGVSKESVGLSTIPFAAMSGGVAVWSWVADRWSVRASATTVRKVQLDAPHTLPWRSPLFILRDVLRSPLAMPRRSGLGDELSLDL